MFPSDLPLFSICVGLQLHDTCNDEDLIERHLFNLISATRNGGRSVIGSNSGSSSSKRDRRKGRSGAGGYGPPLLGEKE